MLLEPIGTSTSQSPQLYTTWPTPMQMAVVGIVFFRSPRGKILLATIDIVALVSSTPSYFDPQDGYVPKAPGL